MTHQNIQVRTNKACNQVFFMFTGTGQGLFVDPLMFFRSCKILDRNLVVFRHTDKNYYMDGIGDGIDSLKALIEWQRAFLRASPWIEKIYCIGTSAGGPIALISGHALRANEVWAFAMVHPEKRLISRGMGSFRFPRRLDPRSFLAKSNGQTQYNLYYSSGHERDATQAGRLADCNGVRLHPMPGTKHNVMTAITEANLLENLLPKKTTSPKDGLQHEPYCEQNRIVYS